jgi:hypothetical protein
MNITKQQWTIIGVVVAIILVWYFFLRKKKAESGYKGIAPFRKRLDFLPSESQQPRYHCDWTDPRTGQVTTYEGPCNKAKANMGWVTIFD